MLKLPKWLNPPTAKEITSCFSANDLGTKGIPCLEEGLEQITKGILTPGPACCSFAAALVFLFDAAKMMGIILDYLNFSVYI
ncbi:hypothetical protein L484_006022 [Morus notabilis]|uniref:Uncharacterized protein n=1 Tax=Morus notabilis TaxID=981085 RepID=W9QZU2_9ROSA|nr:hypothetical protein L484_006022 [Morus notabilis]